MVVAVAAIAALELAGGYFASQNIKDTAKINRDVANMNAEFAELDAYDALLSGETAKSKYQSLVDQTLSDQNTIFAAQGIDSGFGSAKDIQDETRFIADLNKMEIEKQYEEQALGYERESRGITMRSHLDYSRQLQRSSDVMFKSITNAAKTGTKEYGRNVKVDITGYGR